jgi:hypothetical protein
LYSIVPIWPLSFVVGYCQSRDPEKKRPGSLLRKERLWIPLVETDESSLMAPFQFHELKMMRSDPRAGNRCVATES